MDQTGQQHDSIQLFSNISKVNLYSNSHLLRKSKRLQMLDGGKFPAQKKCLMVANFQPRKSAFYVVQK
jgi:hypothetical protein